MTIPTSTTALTAAIQGFGDAVIARRIAGGQFIGPAYTKPEVVAFVPAPEFDASLSNVFYLGVMTNNVPGVSIVNPADGQTINIRFEQDATGGWVITLPGNVLATGTPSVDPLDVSILTITYNLPETRWEGSWTVVAA